jgi:hypothetical protein
MTLSGIEPGTFRLETLCLNQIRYRMPPTYLVVLILMHSFREMSLCIAVEWV